MHKTAMLVLVTSTLASAQSSPTSVSTVLPYSGIYSPPTYTTGSGISASLPSSLLGIYTYTGTQTAPGPLVENPLNYPVSGTFTSILQVANTLNSSIATALSVIPLASPASGVIFKSDPATGTPLPADSTLGPILVERAETIGKHKFFLGVTHQDYHFTSLNGQPLNGLSLLYKGGYPSQVIDAAGSTTTEPATFNLGMDLRFSQDVAFLTYGVTDHLDITVGLPMVHASEAATTYNATLYSGSGTGVPTCWCVDTFTPGQPTLYVSDIGSAHMGKTGIGDVLFRAKDVIVDKPNGAIAIGVDVRAPTGDASNYLGTGAASVKPFVAASLYTTTVGSVVFAPHLNFGWQFSGDSPLGGTLKSTPGIACIGGGTPQNSCAGGSTFTDQGGPFTTVNGKLPDVLSWALGTEIAAGRHNTFVVDILGNEIGLIDGVYTLTKQMMPGFSPVSPFSAATAQGFACASSSAAGTPNSQIVCSRNSFGEYSGAFGYKARVIGNLVVTFNALVRFDNNGLTARFVPMYGLGYTFP